MNNRGGPSIQWDQSRRCRLLSSFWSCVYLLRAILSFHFNPWPSRGVRTLSRLWEVWPYVEKSGNEEAAPKENLSKRRVSTGEWFILSLNRSRTDPNSGLHQLPKSMQCTVGWLRGKNGLLNGELGVEGLRIRWVRKDAREWRSELLALAS